MKKLERTHVTEAMRTRKPRHKLSCNTDLLAGILASAMDAIIAVDDALRIVLFNSAAEKMFVCRAQEVIGNPIDRFIPQRFRAVHIEHVHRFREDGVTVRRIGSLGTVWAVRSNGEEFPIEASISKVESGGKKFFTVIIRDTTERHRAEEAVRESEQRFRLVADSAPVLIWMSGTDKLCTYFNKTWLDFTGRSVDEELGNGWAQGVHPEDLQRCMDTYVQAFDRREEFRMEYRLRRHDGSYRWILDIGVPRFDQNRCFAGYIGIGVDVTDRVLADEVRFRHAAIVESSDDAIVGVGTNGSVTNWNKGAERLFGYSAKEAIGRHISFLSTADRLEEWQDVLKKVLNGEAVRHYETVRRRKDGIHVELSLTVSPIIDAENRIVGASGIARDITERKYAEAQRLLSENRFRKFFETMPEYCYMITPTGEIIEANPAACAALGYAKAELVGQPVAMLYTPECRAKMSELFERWRAQGELRNEEMVIITKQGQRRTVLLTVGSVTDSDGNALHSTSVQVDITERKRAEEALSDMNRRLLDAQEQERVRIARELHDDVNQRLSLLTIQLDQMKAASSATADWTSRLEQLAKATRDISADVHTIAHHLHSSKLDFLGLVPAVQEVCREMSLRHEIDIEVEATEVAESLGRDITICVYRVIQEALQNVVRHSGAREARVSISKERNQLITTVSDDGCGFDPDSLAPGKGLGLVTMRERLRLVHGKLRLESAPGTGSRIHLTVPLEADAE